MQIKEKYNALVWGGGEGMEVEWLLAESATSAA